MTTVTVPRFVKKNPAIKVHRNGIDMWGLYAEAIRFNGLGEPSEVGRWFVAGNMVCFYRKPIDGVRTVWRFATYATPEIAQAEFKSRIERGGWILRGSMILTQLKAPDKIAIDNGKMPNARYIAVLAHEDAFGQALVDSAVTPTAIDDSVIEWATSQGAEEPPPSPFTVVGSISVDLDDSELPF